MKRTRAALAVLAIAAGTAALLPVTAAMAAPAKPPPKGEYAFGEIRSGNNPNWCLTFPKHVENHSPVDVQQCIKGDAQQIWFMERVLVAGHITLIFLPDVHLGQHGKDDNQARLVDELESPKDPNLIGFFPIEGTPRFVLEIIGWVGHKNEVLSSAAVMRHGHTYDARWQRIASTKKGVELFQSWDLPPWKPVK